MTLDTWTQMFAGLSLVTEELSWLLPTWTKTLASARAAPVQLLLKLSATLIAALVGGHWPHSLAYLPTLPCDEPSINPYRVLVFSPRGQSQKHSPWTSLPWIHRQTVYPGNVFNLLMVGDSKNLYSSTYLHVLSSTTTDGSMMNTQHLPSSNTEIKCLAPDHLNSCYTGAFTFPHPSLPVKVSQRLKPATRNTLVILQTLNLFPRNANLKKTSNTSNIISVR